MIQYIDKLMQDWARWTKVRKDGGLGYPSHSSGCRLMVASSGSHADIVGVDEQCMEMEQIVIAMRIQKPEFHKIVDWFYLAGNVTVDRIARELGCHRDTVYVKLHSMHQYVMMAMQDNDVARADMVDAMRSQKKFSKIA